MEIFSYDFMVRAFIAGVMMALIAPIIGNLLVIKRLAFIADTLSHIALSGIALSLIFNLNTQLTTILITSFSALIVEKIRSEKKLPGEAILAMFLPGGLAISIVLISLANGFNANLFSLLFGSITTVTNFDLYTTFILGIITIFFITYYYRQLIYVALDEESAIVSGINVRKINIIIALLTAVIISLAMRIVGVLLIGAMMVIPVLSAFLISKSIKTSIIYSILFAQTAVISGLLSAYYLNLPAGGVIVIMSLFIFGIIYFYKIFHK